MIYVFWPDKMLSLHDSTTRGARSVVHFGLNDEKSKRGD